MFQSIAVLPLFGLRAHVYGESADTYRAMSTPVSSRSLAVSTRSSGFISHFSRIFMIGFLFYLTCFSSLFSQWKYQSNAWNKNDISNELFEIPLGLSFINFKFYSIVLASCSMPKFRFGCMLYFNQILTSMFLLFDVFFQSANDVIRIDYSNMDRLKFILY